MSLRGRLQQEGDVTHATQLTVIFLSPQSVLH